MKMYVCGFYVNNERVALIRKTKPEWQKGRLNGVGGKIEEGETPAQAMAREFMEETGHLTYPQDWFPTVILSGSGWRVYFFAVRAGYFDYNPEFGDSGETCEWHPLSDLPPETMPNLRWLIPLSFDPDIKVPVHIHDRSNPEVNGASVSTPIK